MSNWSRKFPSPISAQSNKVKIATLAQARDYILSLHHQYTDQACWQSAAGELMQAARSGQTDAACDAMHRALVVTLLLWNDPWIRKQSHRQKTVARRSR